MVNDDDIRVYCRDCYEAIYNYEMYVSANNEEWNCTRYYCEKCAKKRKLIPNIK